MPSYYLNGDFGSNLLDGADVSSGSSDDIIVVRGDTNYTNPNDSTPYDLTQSPTVGNDTIGGADNVVENLLYGEADTISGGLSASPSLLVGGNDVLFGGENVGFAALSYSDPWNYGNFLYGDAYLIRSGSSANKRVGGGADTLVGGASSTYEYLYGDAYRMTNATTDPSRVFGGNDILFGSSGTNYSNLYGDAAEVPHAAYLGNDKLVGGNDNYRQVLCGDTYDMGSTGNFNIYAGSDRLWGGNASRGPDLYVVGDAFSMYRYMVSGNDFLYSSGSHLWSSITSSTNFAPYNGYTNWMIGDAYTGSSNYVAATDRLFSGPGQDFFYGDHVEGSTKKAPDFFVFSSVVGNGNDVIVDYTAASNRAQTNDTLVFTGEFYAKMGSTNDERLQWLKDRVVLNGTTALGYDIGVGDTYFRFNSAGGRSSTLFVVGLKASDWINKSWSQLSTSTQFRFKFVDPASPGLDSALLPIGPDVTAPTNPF